MRFFYFSKDDGIGKIKNYSLHAFTSNNKVAKFMLLFVNYIGNFEKLYVNRIEEISK